MWIDRLTQTTLKALPASIDAGRYQNAGTNERFNQHSDIPPGQLLISDGSVHWQLLSGRGNFNKSAIDNPERITLFQQAILTLGESLNKTENLASRSTETKALLSPLLPAAVINAELNLLPFEERLQRVLEAGHLHEIAHHPRLDIRYIEETTDVARAKRLAKDALVHLASHSECWQRQTLSGVVPKKVKARFSEDDYQIYENRVFARLIDKLHRHLHSRIRTVEQLQQTLNDALGFENNSDAIDYRVSQKNLRFVGANIRCRRHTPCIGIAEKYPAVTQRNAAEYYQPAAIRPVSDNSTSCAGGGCTASHQHTQSRCPLPPPGNIVG